MWKKKTVSNGESSSDNTTKAQDNFKKALDWETSRLELVEKSEKERGCAAKFWGFALYQQRQPLP
ncbi:MAG: hypothetical protein ACLSE8_10695 [Parasutterella sp.]